MREFDVWQYPGKHGYYGPEYEEERLGAFISVIIGLEPGTSRERLYNVYVSDIGMVGRIETRYSYLKPIAG